MAKKKLSKAEKKAKKAQDATDALAVVLDRAQDAVLNYAGPEENLSVLKAVIDKKKAAFVKLGQSLAARDDLFSAEVRLRDQCRRCSGRSTGSPSETVSDGTESCEDGTVGTVCSAV